MFAQRGDGCRWFHVDFSPCAPRHEESALNVRLFNAFGVVIGRRISCTEYCTHAYIQELDEKRIHMPLLGRKTHNTSKYHIRYAQLLGRTLGQWRNTAPRPSARRPFHPLSPLLLGRRLITTRTQEPCLSAAHHCLRSFLSMSLEGSTRHVQASEQDGETPTRSG